MLRANLQVYSDPESSGVDSVTELNKDTFWSRKDCVARVWARLPYTLLIIGRKAYFTVRPLKKSVLISPMSLSFFKAY